MTTKSPRMLNVCILLVFSTLRCNIRSPLLQVRFSCVLPLRHSTVHQVSVFNPSCSTHFVYKIYKIQSHIGCICILSKEEHNYYKLVL